MKKKIITRTLVTTEVKVMGIVLSEAKTIISEFSLVGSFKDNNDILNYIKATYEDGTIVYAMVTEVTEKETLYGMTESEFMSHAKQLPPRKVYETWTAK